MYESYHISITASQHHSHQTARDRLFDCSEQLPVHAPHRRTSPRPNLQKMLSTYRTALPAVFEKRDSASVIKKNQKRRFGFKLLFGTGKYPSHNHSRLEIMIFWKWWNTASSTCKHRKVTRFSITIKEQNFGKKKKTRRSVCSKTWFQIDFFMLYFKSLCTLVNDEFINQLTLHTPNDTQFELSSHKI